MPTNTQPSRPPSLIAPVLMLTYPLLVLMVVGRGQHGYPDWSAAMQNHTQQTPSNAGSIREIIIVTHFTGQCSFSVLQKTIRHNIVRKTIIGPCNVLSTCSTTVAIAVSHNTG